VTGSEIVSKISKLFMGSLTMLMSQIESKYATKGALSAVILIKKGDSLFFKLDYLAFPIH
jgi:hypothetical protein